MRRLALRFLFTLAFLVPPLSLEAAESCLPAYPIVDRSEWWDFSMITRSNFTLPSRNSYGYFDTYAAAHLEWDRQLKISFDYRTPEDMAGLEYNLYRVEIQVGRGAGQYTYVQDFTRECSSPGRSMFPGQSIRLNPVKVPPGFLGFPRGREVVRIRIWGHL